MTRANVSSLDGFESATGLNPITVEVIGSALESTVDEMGEALVRASHSANIKERRDCSTAIFDPEGRVLCQAEHIPLHLGSFIDFVPLLLKRYRIQEISAGDVFVGNDPYEGGGTHLPDIVLAEPVFVEGALAAWAINTAHHTDFADRGHAHIYQEGLRIPPIKLYRKGKLQQDVQDLILLNCQVPAERLSDLRAQMAANRLGVLRIKALFEKYGAAVVAQAGRELQDYAERKMRAGIRRIPDGVYKAFEKFDADDKIFEEDISVTITVKEDEMYLHFESPPQVRLGINMTYTALLACVYYSIKSIVDPNIPPNAGLARPLHVTAKEGTIFNCVHPAAVDVRHATTQRVPDLIMAALADVIPQQVTGASCGSMSGTRFIGQRPDGTTWIYVETIAGGSGGRYNKDGLDGVQVHTTNTSNLPVEALEAEYPLTILRYELIDGSGGEGTYRGGMGVRRVYRADAPCRPGTSGDSRRLTRPWGIHGGLEGAAGQYRITAPDQNKSFKPGDVIPAGAVVEVMTPGGGGYGPPSGRSAEKVARDIRHGVISKDRAQKVYSVRA
ncbi:N-methylhydantoinase B [Bradyrhizobium diazoefficiens]|uniref:hydantoinase B/oxoprolinase family protein n=1 Tax=Bradyrhizobium diazoefficiens TaxID=1355477 RepID=UPI0035151511